MEFETLRNKQVYLIDRDNSPSKYKDDSKKIAEEIRKEIWNGEYSKPIYYYGISDVLPELDKFTNGDRSKVCVSDNCVFPDKYNNTLVYVAEDKVIHWFVSPKDVGLERGD